MFLWFVVQQWQEAFAVLAEIYHCAVPFQDDGIVIGSYVHQRHLEQLALRHRRPGLSLHEVFLCVAQFQDVYPGTDHAQTAELVLPFAPLRQFAGLVKDQLAGHFAVLGLQVFHIADYVAALVHVKQHGIPAVLLHVHACGQHTGAVAVQAVV